MAKMKTFMVRVEVVKEINLFVEARRPNGAKDKIQTDEGWREATRYADEYLPSWFDPKTMTVKEVKDIS